MNVNPLTPINVVKVLKSVPLDSSYTDTLDFASVSAQADFFTSKMIYTFSNLTPIRMQNTIKLPIGADYLYECNYIMFQNANFKSKWFYAFINSINFVNVNMCEISFTLDVLQTWQFDYVLKPSYVEREHSLIDTVGSNLVNESVELGDYVNERAYKTPFFNSYTAVIASSYSSEGSSGGKFGGLFSGINFIGGEIETQEGINTLLMFLALLVADNKVDTIAATFTMPTDFYTTQEDPDLRRFDVAKSITSLGSYTPRNKKLLTYPYNFLSATSSDGGSVAYRYEYFGDSGSGTNVCSFLLSCGMSCNPEVVLQPAGYDHQTFGINETLTVGGFPQFAYNIDSFRLWLAQSANTLPISNAVSAISIAGGIATANPMAVAGGVLGLASNVNAYVQNATKSDQTRGAQGGDTMTATKQKNFYFYARHIREDYAKCIDDYFTMYGYATNQVKVPTTKGRPSWNYTKTAQAKITGAVPFDDLTKIKDIFNKGITFWHGDWVGDYGRAN